MINGYVRIYRTLTQKGYYSRSEYVHLWVHLIMKATYQDREYLFNGAIQNLEPGQFITGRKQLSKETGISETTIERILSLFESEHQIGQQKNNKFRIISILNWNEYQTDGQQNGQQTDSKRTANGHLADTNNKENKDKNVKKFIIPSIDEVSFYCSERRNKINPEIFFNHYQANGWMVGKNKMKDWKAAIITWEGRNGNGSRQNNSGSAGQIIKKAGNSQSDGEPWPADREY
jgi:hypothetical protein